MTVPVFGSAAAWLSRCILPVLCVSLFVLLFVNDGLIARVYDGHTLLFIRVSLMDGSGAPPVLRRKQAGANF